MNTDNIFGIHVAAVKARGERAEILARNMANADTPGYKARDIDFNELLASKRSAYSNLRTTQTGHIKLDGHSATVSELKYRVPLQDSVDGNSVDMQTERAEFMRNALMYQTSLQFLNGRISGLMTAIRGE